MEPTTSHHADERILSAIGYAGILFLIPLFLKKDSVFCQFHAKQGFILFMAWVINTTLLVIPFVGWLVGFFGSIFLAVITIMAIVKTVNGEQWEFPLIGEYARKITL